MFYLRTCGSHNFVKKVMTRSIAKSRKNLRIVTIFFFLMTFFVTTAFKKSITAHATSGESLYKRNCSRCHGADGTKEFLGAKNLKRSILSDEDILQKIQNGKGFMPSFSKKFSDDELNQILLYVKSLRRG